MKLYNSIAIRTLALFGALICLNFNLSAAASTGIATNANQEYDFNLGVGGRVFWPQEPVNVDSGFVQNPDNCSSDPGSINYCWEYRLRLAPGGKRLRVALSTVLQDQGDVRLIADIPFNSPEAQFTIQLINPQGVVVAQGSTFKEQALAVFSDVFYAGEVFTAEPVGGIWKVKVIPNSVQDMAFRLRAKLETPGEPSSGSQSGTPLTPNLRAIPPFEFNFNTVPGSFATGATLPGVHPSCMPEEVFEFMHEAVLALEPSTDSPTLCLRFSMGLENAGTGPLILRGFSKWRDEQRPGQPLNEWLTQQYMTQQRMYVGEPFPKNDQFGGAGSGNLENWHAHFHYLNAWEWRLYHVTDPNWRPGAPTPVLLPVGPGRKLGFLPGPEKISDWERFDQPERDFFIPRNHFRTYGTECPERNTDIINCQYDDGSFFPPMLQAGWGDVYEWNRGGNYVALPLTFQTLPGVPRQGFYLLRGKVNPLGLIIETDYDDNFSFALIEILGNGAVKLRERGYGLAPWDPRKRVLTEAP